MDFFLSMKSWKKIKWTDYNQASMDLFSLKIV